MGTRREIDGEKSMKRKERDGDGKERGESAFACARNRERESAEGLNNIESK